MKITEETISKMKATDIIIGTRYNLSGDLQNGSHVTHEEVTRKVIRVTDTRIICECGREFIINDNLKIELFDRCNY